jgi:hypothetical protein
MLKKIGLSAAAILAVVALAKPSAAMAGDRDDFRYGDRDQGRRLVQENREYREYRERNEHRRPEWRGYERRVNEDRDRNWR